MFLISIITFSQIHTVAPVAKKRKKIFCEDTFLCIFVGIDDLPGHCCIYLIYK